MAVCRIINITAGLAEKLDVDLYDLPIAASAPQWFEEQALGDAAFGLDSGFLVHVYPDPFISGSELVTRVLTQDLGKLTGGKLLVEKMLRRRLML
jgi:carbon-monoxide dehydrogenase catalytic subunit